MESAGVEGSSPVSTAPASNPARVQFTLARLPMTCQLAMPRSLGTVSIVTTVPVPGFGQSRVTIAMTPPRAETTPGTDPITIVVLVVDSEEQPGILEGAGASIQ